MRGNSSSGTIDAHLLRVVDRASGQPLGTVATINSEGFVVSLKQRVAEGTVLELAVDLPDSAPGSEQDSQPELQQPIHLGAVSLWSSRASVSNSYWAAFQIIDISRENQQRLDRLVDRCRPVSRRDN